MTHAPHFPLSLGVLSLFMRVSLVALALGAAACGGSIGADSVALDDFEPELRDAACAYLVACEQMPDRATCLAVGLGDSSELATLKADVAAGTLTYDGQAARACIDVFKRFASCKATQIGDPQSGVAVCQRVFIGRVPPGGACFFGDECADEGICSRTDCTTAGCCAGICEARAARIPAGGSCLNPPQYQECVEGTACSTTSQTCEPPLAPGARCTVFDNCVAPYYCGSIDLATSMGTCTPPPDRGQPCGTGGVTSSCNDYRDSCDPVTHVCTGRVPVGGACTLGSPPYCVDYADCDGTACVRRPGVGASCDPLLPASDCLGNLQCDATTELCVLPPVSGSCR